LVIRDVVGAMDAALRGAEENLGRIDAIAGDGDHGRGMVKGVSAATDAAGRVPEAAGAACLLGRVGQAWAAEAGGTSGVLWGAALEAFGRELGDDATEIGAADIAAASGAFARAIQQ